MKIEDFNLPEALRTAYDAALAARGKVNLLIAGKTGTGKSTLLNAIFGIDFAETGQGRPITQHMRKYTKEGSPVAIYDSKGLELADYKSILNDLKTKVRDINSGENADDYIHIAWLCIAEGARRIEDAEIDLAAALNEVGVPVILVITTAVSDNGFRAAVQDECPNVVNVVRVNSLPFEMDEGMIVPAKGIGALVDVTMEVVPKTQKNAFAAAQRIKTDHKVTRSRIAVGVAASAAAAAGAVPIPFADAAAIVPIQLTMLASISAFFGLNVDSGFLSTLVAGTFTSVAGTMGGRALVGGLLKLIPGAGSVVGGVISGGVAATLTTTFGEAYIQTLKRLFDANPGELPEASAIAVAFKRQLGGSGST